MEPEKDDAIGADLAHSIKFKQKSITPTAAKLKNLEKIVPQKDEVELNKKGLLRIGHDDKFDAMTVDHDAEKLETEAMEGPDELTNTFSKTKLYKPFKYSGNQKYIHLEGFGGAEGSDEISERTHITYVHERDMLGNRIL